jgi:hypothetical protein
VHLEARLGMYDEIRFLPAPAVEDHLLKVRGYTLCRLLRL